MIQRLLQVKPHKHRIFKPLESDVYAFIHLFTTVEFKCLLFCDLDLFGVKQNCSYIYARKCCSSSGLLNAQSEMGLQFNGSCPFLQYYHSKCVDFNWHRELTFYLNT